MWNHYIWHGNIYLSRKRGSLSSMAMNTTMPRIIRLILFYYVWKFGALLQYNVMQL
jgi:hypothetical protein